MHVRTPVRARPRWRLVAFCLAVLFGTCAPAVAFGAIASARDRQAADVHRGQPMAGRHPTSMSTRDPRSGTTLAPLVFGIYPGGAAGTVGPSGPTKPENPAHAAGGTPATTAGTPAVRPASVRRLHGSGRILGAAAGRRGDGRVRPRRAFRPSSSLTYRPANGGSSADVAGFVRFVRATLDIAGTGARVRVASGHQRGQRGWRAQRRRRLLHGRGRMR